MKPLQLTLVNISTYPEFRKRMIDFLESKCNTFTDEEKEALTNAVAFSISESLSLQLETFKDVHEGLICANCNGFHHRIECDKEYLEDNGN